MSTKVDMRELDSACEGRMDASGNPIGAPQTIPLALDGLSASTRDGHIGETIAELLALAERHGARAVVIENLDFADQRANGREHAAIARHAAGAVVVFGG